VDPVHLEEINFTKSISKELNIPAICGDDVIT
jgi:hypothetical protein